MIHIEKIIRQMFPYNWQQNYILVRDHISLRMQRTIRIFNSGPKSRFSAISNYSCNRDYFLFYCSFFFC